MNRASVVIYSIPGVMKQIERGMIPDPGGRLLPEQPEQTLSAIMDGYPVWAVVEDGRYIDGRSDMADLWEVWRDPAWTWLPGRGWACTGPDDGLTLPGFFGTERNRFARSFGGCVAREAADDAIVTVGYAVVVIASMVPR